MSRFVSSWDGATKVNSRINITRRIQPPPSLAQMVQVISLPGVTNE